MGMRIHVYVVLFDLMGLVLGKIDKVIEDTHLTAGRFVSDFVASEFMLGVPLFSPGCWDPDLD